MAKVFIGVGHGGSDAGAVGYVVEKDVNLKMAKACRDYLKNKGVQVLMSRETDIDDSLSNKIDRCNKFNPDYALDIHNNAGKGDGFEVFHSIIGGRGKALAENIETEVKKIGQNSRGLKTKTNSSGTDYFGFIREVNCPSIICEGAFVDNEEDASQIDTDAECKAFGIAYAKGILKTLNISETPKPVEPSKSNSIKYRVYQQTYGWSKWCYSGEWAGVKGKSKRIEAIQIDPGTSRKISVKVHIQGIGDVDYGIIDKNRIIGTTEQSRRLELIEVTGAKIQCHIETIGDAPNYSSTQGTKGLGLRIESIRMI